MLQARVGVLAILALLLISGLGAVAATPAERSLSPSKTVNSFVAPALAAATTAGSSLKWSPNWGNSTFPGMSWPASTYDPALGGVLLFGEYQPGHESGASNIFTGRPVAATFELRPGGIIVLNLSHYLPRLLGATMAWDYPLHEVVLFGGMEYSRGYAVVGGTWAFSNGSWSNLTGRFSTAPPPRSGASLVYDPAIRGLLLFGGQGAGPSYAYFNDTWEFTASGWTNLTSSAGAAPAARSQTSLVYDADANEAVLFGGTAQTASCTVLCVYGDTWTFRSGHWHPLNLSGPTARLGDAITYDPLVGEVVLYGGWNGSYNKYGGFLSDSDTWRFDNSTWTRLSISGPNPLWSSSLTFDPESGTCLLYGGYGQDVYGGWHWMSDVWTLS